MSIRRITLRGPEAIADRIKKAAGEKPVSTRVAALIEDHLDDNEQERQWQAFCRDVSPSAKDARRARAMFNRLTKPARPRGAA